MIWQNIYSDFKRYLQFERGLSENTINAYLQDISKLMLYCEKQKLDIMQLGGQDIQNFLGWINTFSISPATQARLLSGLKSFYNYMQLVHDLAENTKDLIEAQTSSLNLPDVISYTLIDALYG